MPIYTSDETKESIRLVVRNVKESELVAFRSESSTELASTKSRLNTTHKVALQLDSYKDNIQNSPVFQEMQSIMPDPNIAGSGKIQVLRVADYIPVWKAVIHKGESGEEVKEEVVLFKKPNGGFFLDEQTQEPYSFNLELWQARIHLDPIASKSDESVPDMSFAPVVDGNGVQGVVAIIEHDIRRNDQVERPAEISDEDIFSGRKGQVVPKDSETDQDKQIAVKRKKQGLARGLAAIAFAANLLGPVNSPEQPVQNINKIVLDADASLLIQTPTEQNTFTHPQTNEPATEIMLVTEHPATDMTQDYQIFPEQNQRVERSDNPLNQTEKAATTSKLDLLKTDETYIKYGEYALSGPSIVNPDVILATVREYRDSDEHADEIAHWINIYADQYGINKEVVMTAFMIQESSFGKITGNISGDYNIGNIRAASTGKFLDFDSYEQGVDAIFWQVDRYDKVWPTEKNDDSIHEIGQAMEVYAPPNENPTQDRIEVAKEFIDSLRIISDQYEQGRITKKDLQDKIHELRASLQQKHGAVWI